MSVKTDSSGRRLVAVEVEVPGTPEEVWEAIATGPGITSWFVPTEMRADGSMVLTFGPGMEATARKTAWDPPRRFAAEGEGFAPGAPPLATEWTVEARAGGTCIVRVVHSLFTSSDEWDDQLEATESGWPGFFRTLRLYLTHFRGQHGATIQVFGTSPQPASATWPQLAGALTLDALAAGGVWAAPTGAPTLAGHVVDSGDEPPHQRLIQLHAPLPGIAHVFVVTMGPQTLVAIRIYLYGDSAPAIVARDEPVWQQWLARRFPMPSA